MKPTGKCRCIWPRPMIPRKLVGFYAWVCKKCGKVKRISMSPARIHRAITKSYEACMKPYYNHKIVESETNHICGK